MEREKSMGSIVYGINQRREESSQHRKEPREYPGALGDCQHYAA